MGAGRDLALTWSRMPPFGGWPVDEQVGLEDDGTAWLWVGSAADPTRADLVGTFRFSAGRERVREALDLVALLGSGSPAAAGEPRGGAAPTAVVAGPDGSAHHLAADGPDAARGLLAILDGLTIDALAAPLAAARFSAVAALAGSPEALALVVAGEGLESVTLRFDPAQLWVEWLDGEQPVGRDAVPDLPIGLLDEAGELVDGLFAPARIPPGTSAATTLPVAAGTARAGLVTVGGRIRLLRPTPSIDMPLDAFAARTRPVFLPPPDPRRATRGARSAGVPSGVTKTGPLANRSRRRASTLANPSALA